MCTLMVYPFGDCAHVKHGLIRKIHSIETTFFKYSNANGGQEARPYFKAYGSSFSKF